MYIVTIRIKDPLLKNTLALHPNTLTNRKDSELEGLRPTCNEPPPFSTSITPSPAARPRILQNARAVI